MNSYEISEMMVWNFRLEDKSIEARAQRTKLWMANLAKWEIRNFKSLCCSAILQIYGQRNESRLRTFLTLDYCYSAISRRKLWMAKIAEWELRTLNFSTESKATDSKMDRMREL